jgi:hypothetical protein
MLYPLYIPKYKYKGGAVRRNKSCTTSSSPLLIYKRIHKLGHRWGEKNWNNAWISRASGKNLLTGWLKWIRWGRLCWPNLRSFPSFSSFFSLHNRHFRQPAAAALILPPLSKLRMFWRFDWYQEANHSANDRIKLNVFDPANRKLSRWPPQKQDI